MSTFPTVFEVKLKPGLKLQVEICGHETEDAKEIRRAASLLIEIAGMVEDWQSQNGSFGTPIQPSTVAEMTPRVTQKGRKR